MRLEAAQGRAMAEEGALGVCMPASVLAPKIARDAAPVGSPGTPLSQVYCAQAHCGSPGSSPQHTEHRGTAEPRPEAQRPRSIFRRRHGGK